jgi:hypothetical protein
MSDRILEEDLVPTLPPPIHTSRQSCQGLEHKLSTHSQLVHKQRALGALYCKGTGILYKWTKEHSVAIGNLGSS